MPCSVRPGCVGRAGLIGKLARSRQDHDHQEPPPCDIKGDPVTQPYWPPHLLSSYPCHLFYSQPQKSLLEKHNPPGWGVVGLDMAVGNRTHTFTQLKSKCHGIRGATSLQIQAGSFLFAEWPILVCI